VCSSSLEALRLQARRPQFNATLDDLISPQSEKQLASIRVFDLRCAYVNMSTFKKLCEICLEVEELHITSDITSLVSNSHSH
jgi:hypothetical protein